MKELIIFYVTIGAMVEIGIWVKTFQRYEQATTFKTLINYFLRLPFYILLWIPRIAFTIFDLAHFVYDNGKDY
jgi:hypothetical protein